MAFFVSNAAQLSQVHLSYNHEAALDVFVPKIQPKLPSSAEASGMRGTSKHIQDIIVTRKVERGEREGKSVRLVDGLGGLDRGPR